MRPARHRRYRPLSLVAHAFGDVVSEAVDVLDDEHSHRARPPEVR